MMDNPPLAEFSRNRLDLVGSKEPFSPTIWPFPEVHVLDYFALVAESDWRLSPGRYRVRTLSDDGVRVYFDDRRVIDDWEEHGAEENVAEMDVDNGPHTARVEYFQGSGPCRLQFSIVRIDAPRSNVN